MLFSSFLNANNRLANQIAFEKEENFFHMKTFDALAFKGQIDDSAIRFPFQNYLSLQAAFNLSME